MPQLKNSILTGAQRDLRRCNSRYLCQAELFANSFSFVTFCFHWHIHLSSLAWAWKPSSAIILIRSPVFPLRSDWLNGLRSYFWKCKASPVIGPKIHANRQFISGPVFNVQVMKWTIKGTVHSCSPVTAEGSCSLLFLTLRKCCLLFGASWGM